MLLLPTILFTFSRGAWLALAVGALLALGLVARATSKIVQALAGAAPVVLVATMLFTFSRGAWLALAVGLLVALAVDARRLQLLAATVVLSLAPGLVLLLATTSDHLTKQDVRIREAADEGGTLLVWVVVLALVSAGLAVGFRLAGDRVDVAPRTKRAIGAGVIAVAVVALVAVFAVEGAPWTLASDAVDRFRAPPKASGVDARAVSSTCRRTGAWSSGASRSISSETTRWLGQVLEATRLPGIWNAPARGQSAIRTASTSRRWASSGSSGSSGSSWRSRSRW